MTLAIERPRTVTVPITYPCPVGTPWCNDEAASACPPDEHTTCWSGELYLPATAGRNADGRIPVNRVSVLVAQNVGKEPTIALNVIYSDDRWKAGDDAEMTLDEAERLALFLLARIAELRGGEVR